MQADIKIGKAICQDLLVCIWIFVTISLRNSTIIINSKYYKLMEANFIYHHREVDSCYVVIQGTLWQMRQKVPISSSLVCHSPVVNMMLNIGPFYFLSKDIRTWKEDTQLCWFYLFFGFQLIQCFRPPNDSFFLQCVKIFMAENIRLGFY